MNNRGFTLIELIITMAVAAVLICGVGLSFNLLEYADTKSCAEMVNTTMDKLRLETMSKGEKYHYLIIEWKNSQEKYYLNTVTSEVPLDESNWAARALTIRSKELADRNISIVYTKEPDGSNIKNIDTLDPCLIIQFDKGSGAYLSDWRQIIISSRADTSVIQMVTKTGKHYIKD